MHATKPKEEVPLLSDPRKGTMTARIGASMLGGIKSSMPCNNLQQKSHNNQLMEKTRRVMLDGEELEEDNKKVCGYTGSAG